MLHATCHMHNANTPPNKLRFQYFQTPKWITGNVDHSEVVVVRAAVAVAVAVAEEIRVRITEINKNESPARPSWTWPSSWTRPSPSSSMEGGKVSAISTPISLGAVQLANPLRSRRNFEGL